MADDPTAETGQLRVTDFNFSFPDGLFWTTLRGDKDQCDALDYLLAPPSPLNDNGLIRLE